MVYGLPTIDPPEGDWGRKVNASIEAVKETADAALPLALMGAPSGVAPLDEEQRLPEDHVPARLGAPVLADTFSPASPGHVSAYGYGRDLGLNPGDDWSAAIAGALSDAVAERKSVQLPGFRIGLSAALNPAAGALGMRGHGRRLSEIELAPDIYAIDNTQTLWQLLLRDFAVIGGKGLLRDRGTGLSHSSNHMKVISGVEVFGFTECAVQVNSSNSPYWKYLDVVLRAATDAGTIGIAHAGPANQSYFRGLVNGCQIGLKLVRPGDFEVDNTSFIHLGAPTGGKRANIWTVPNSLSGSQGGGFYVHGTKFGEENKAPSDVELLIAGEGAGSYVGDRLPDLTTVRTEKVEGYRFLANHIGGAAGRGPFCYSMTPDLRGLQFVANHIEGTDPTYMVEIDPACGLGITPLRNNLIAMTYDPGSAVEVTSEFTTPCNRPGYFEMMDPTGQWARPGEPQSYPGGDDSAAAGLVLRPAAGSLTLAGGSTKVGSVADMTGGTDAAEFETSATNSSIRTDISAIAPGEWFWIEVDLKQGATSPATTVQVNARKSDRSLNHFRRVVKLDSQWRTYRWRAVVSDITSLRLDICTLNSEAGRFQIGRPRIYQATEPINTKRRKSFGDIEFSASSEGPVLVDRSTGTRYRLMVNSGALSIEIA